MKKQFNRVYIEITNKCNFSCPFCSSLKVMPNEITVAQFTSIATEVKAYTDEICLHVLGEPLLHPNFEEILNVCRTLELRINLVTNGFFIKEKLSVILKYQYLFSKISFSIHSYIYQPKFMLDKLSQIVAAADILAGAGVQIELRNLLGNNHEEFVYALNAATEQVLQAKILNINTNQKLKIRLYYVAKKSFEWPDKTATDFAANFAAADNSPTLTKKNTPSVYCMAGRTHIAILSNLDVVPCCLDSGANLKLGNCKNQSIKELLNSDRFKNIYNSFSRGEANEKFCQTCTYNKSIKN